jgi:hypothetical protein
MKRGLLLSSWKERTGIRFNTNKLNRMQTLHKITELWTEWFSDCSKINSKFNTIARFKSPVKENDDSNKTYRYAHDLSLSTNSFI